MVYASNAIISETQLILRDLEELMIHEEDNLGLFQQWSKPHCHGIGWAQPAVIERLLRHRRIKPDECSIVMIRTGCITECLMHERGAGTFLVMGSGGILTADFVEGKQEYNLRSTRHEYNRIFEIPPGKIYSVFADHGHLMAMLGVICPGILSADGANLDTVKFDYIPQDFERVQVRIAG